MCYVLYARVTFPTVRPPLLWAHSIARSIGAPDYFV